MRTQEEIVAKIKGTTQEEDFFGHKRGDWIAFLTFDNAKEFLKQDALEEAEKEWGAVPDTDEDVLNRIREYLEFAWDKANNLRGLSASRSIEHMEAWIWLLGNEELAKQFDEVEYEHYGKEKLIVISEYVGFNWKEHDDGVRTNGE